MDATHCWTNRTIAGFHAMSVSRREEAARCWVSVAEALRPAGPSDPRYAACQSNAGVGHILLFQQAEAEAALGEAERSWMLVLSNVGILDVPVVGTSSSFHFRLASQNLPAFTEARRRRYAKLCEAALGMTRFNSLCARAMASAQDDVEAARRSLKILLSDILGPGAPELRLLADAPASVGGESSPYAEKISAFRLKQRSMAEALSDDCQRLEDAVALTALITPHLLLEARPQ